MPRAALSTGTAWMAFDATIPKRPAKVKHDTGIGEHRSMAVAEALAPQVRERIHEDAKVQAARILADFERRRR